MMIIILVVFGHIILSSTETIPNKEWSISKSTSFKSDAKTIATHPLNEAFKVLSNNRKKYSSIRSSKSHRLTVINQISSLYNISSTTCKTITDTSTQTVDHPSDLLNDPSYDTDIESFLKMDDEELSKQLINIEATTDGSGDTNEPTSTTTPVSITIELTSVSSSKPTESTTTTIAITNSTMRPELTDLSPHSILIIAINCPNATDILNELLKRFNQTFQSWYNVSYNQSTLQCARSLNTNITLDFSTDNKITVLNNLFKTFASIALDMNIDLYSASKCGDDQIVLVTSVTSCYLIDLCGLCGRNPPRGVCDPDGGLSECKCFVNQNDSSMPYVGEFCLPKKTEPAVSTSSHETTIIIGVLAGVSGLFCSITSCLLVKSYWSRRRARQIHHHNRNKRQSSHECHSSPATTPTSVIAEITPHHLNNTLTTSIRHQKNSNNTAKSTSSKHLDQKRSANLHIKTTNAKLATNLISTTNSYDLIDELDSIIDSEDTSTASHDPLNDIFDDNEMLKVVNTKS